MRNNELTSLYRSTVGFDRLFDLLDQTARVETINNWPPYNIEKVAEDQYRITMAVAGFSPEEIDLTQHETALLVTGQKKPAETEAQFLHRGIATRSFKLSFNLADHVKVTGANLDNGLLSIELRREIPEALKPRRIEIGSGTGRTDLGQDNSKQIEHEPQQQKSKAA